MLGFPVNGSRFLFRLPLALSETFPQPRAVQSLWNRSAQQDHQNSLLSAAQQFQRFLLLLLVESVGNASSPLMSLAPESANTTSIPRGNRSPTPPSSAVYPARVSAAVKQIHKSNTWFLPALLSFLVSMSS